MHAVSDRVEDQLRVAIQALLERDVDLAAEVVLGDRPVNRQLKRIDEECHAFIVRHAPSAGHLRYVSAVLRFNVALERIGDYAGEIGRQVPRLSTAPKGTIARDLDLIGQQVRHTLTEALDAFRAADPDKARTTYGLASQVDLTLELVLAELLRAGKKQKLPLADVFGLLRCAKLLKRVADQSENICEQAVFAATGEGRAPRVYRVLFAGVRNDRASQIAEAYARKAFPESGTYASAGSNPSEALDPALVEFLDTKGMDVREASPTPLEFAQDAAEHFNVIVVLEPGGREHLGEVPYRTTVVEWESSVGEGFAPETLDELYREITVKVRDLMATLAGPDAR